MNKSFINQVFYKSSQKMTEIPDFSVDLIITSPPYFNIKDYKNSLYHVVKALKLEPNNDRIKENKRIIEEYI